MGEILRMSPNASDESTDSPAPVAPDGVDLAIVAQQTEGLGEAPGGEGVGGETAMHQGQATGEVDIGEVGEILAQLEAGEHSLVHDVAARQRADIKLPPLVFG